MNKIKFNIQLSEEQKEAKSKILDTPVNFILGDEGTGKTMLGINIALDLFFRKDNEYHKVIITRPAVSTEDFGYLPGDIKDKLHPYLVPIYETMRDLYGDTEHKRGKIERHLKEEDIRILPIAFTRGVTYNNAVVIVDEFQNCTKHQIEMIIGRLGHNSKLIFTGSNRQIDLKYKKDSCINLIETVKNNPFVSVNVLKKNHRHEAVQSILNTIRDEES